MTDQPRKRGRPPGVKNKKKRKYTDEEKSGKQERLGLEPEPEGVPEEHEIRKHRTEVEKLQKIVFVADNRGRRIRVSEIGGPSSQSFIRECEPSVIGLLRRMKDALDYYMLLTKRYYWTEKRLRQVRDHERDHTEVRKVAGGWQERYHDKKREVQKLQAIIAQLEKDKGEEP